MAEMAVEAKKLDLKVGDVVEIAGRRYDVVADKEGGVALEPHTGPSVEELARRAGGRRLTREEFEQAFGHLPSDSEG
jgi:hypothetical protein